MVKQSKNIILNKKKKSIKSTKDNQSSINPFDKLDNSKKKYQVVNRRLKGDHRDVGKARNKAISDRKTNLLLEYKSLKKSNNFIDKRFGESDNTMTLEDKMFLRFQKEKINKLKYNNIYNLDSIDNDILTHKGKHLNDSNINDNDFIEDNNDDDGLNKDIVNQLHFGGFQPIDNTTMKISKYDSLKDIINKSKIIKQQKKELKDELDTQRDNLDIQYKDLLSGDLLQFKSNKRDKSDDQFIKLTNEVDDYDKSLMEMLFDTKVKPSDRIKSDEEIAKQNRIKLEQLEKERLQRMKANSKSYSESNSSNKKLRNLNDDEMIDDYNDNKRKSNDDFNDNNNEEINNSDDEDNDNEDGSDEVDSEDNDDDSEDYEEDNYDELLDNNLFGKELQSTTTQNKITDSQVSSKVDSIVEKKSEKMSDKKSASSNLKTSTTSIDDIIPHILPCPSNIQSFIELLKQYELETSDFKTIVSRIVMYYSVHIGGQEGVDNKTSMHNFLDVLLKYIVCIGNQLIVPNINTSDIFVKLDYLSTVIFKLTKDIADVVPGLWGRTLKIIHQQVQKKIRDYSLGKCDHTWPTIGQMLLLELVNQLFSVTDWINGVVITSTLIQCQCLITCPINEVIDIYSGIFISSILVDSIVESKRIIPEVMTFLSTILSLYIPIDKLSSSSVTMLKTCNVFNLNWFRNSLHKDNDNDIEPSNQIVWTEFINRSKVSSSVFHSIYNIISTLSNYYETFPGYPELFHNIVTNMALTDIHNSYDISEHIVTHHKSVYNLIVNKCQDMISTRQPLQWRIQETESIQTLPPRYVIDYKMNKQTIGGSNGLINKQVNDSIKSKQQLKQLQKQFKRENKATIRELRRDGQFINQLQYQENANKKLELQQERWNNFKWIEEQQAEVNTYVKKLKGTLKGGGSTSNKIKTKRMKR